MEKKVSFLLVRTGVLFYIPLIFWLSFIWLMSSQEGSGLVTSLSWEYYLERKAGHIFEYFILGILLWRVIGLWTKNTQERIAWTFIWILWMGTFDEVHQTFVFGREGRITDVIIDIAGGFLGVIFIKNVSEKFFQKKK